MKDLGTRAAGPVDRTVPLTCGGNLRGNASTFLLGLVSCSMQPAAWQYQGSTDAMMAVRSRLKTAMDRR